MQRNAPGARRKHSPATVALVYGAIALTVIGANVVAARALSTLAPHASFAALLAVAVLVSATALRLLTVITKAILLPALTRLEASLRIAVANLEARSR